MLFWQSRGVVQIKSSCRDIKGKLLSTITGKPCLRTFPTRSSVLSIEAPRCNRPSVHRQSERQHNRECDEQHRTLRTPSASHQPSDPARDRWFRVDHRRPCRRRWSGPRRAVLQPCLGVCCPRGRWIGRRAKQPVRHWFLVRPSHLRAVEREREREKRGGGGGGSECMLVSVKGKDNCQNLQRTFKGADLSKPREGTCMLSCTRYRFASIFWDTVFLRLTPLLSNSPLSTNIENTVRICYSVGLWFSKNYHYNRCIITSDVHGLRSDREHLSTAWAYPWTIYKIPNSMGCRVVFEHFFSLIHRSFFLLRLTDEKENL